MESAPTWGGSVKPTYVRIGRNRDDVGIVPYRRGTIFVGADALIGPAMLQDIEKPRWKLPARFVFLKAK